MLIIIPLILNPVVGKYEKIYLHRGARGSTGVREVALPGLCSRLIVRQGYCQVLGH